MVSATFDHFLDVVVDRMTPEEILAFQLSETEQQRLDDLIERNNAGLLTAEEKAELQHFADIERTMSLLKVKADYQLRKK